jgi:hypothetical protein
MMRITLFTMLLVASCSGKTTPAPDRNGESSITSLDLRPGDRGSTITFDSGTARGILEVEPGVATSYEVRTKSGGDGDVATTMALVVAGHELQIEGSTLRIGERSVDLPSGEVRVEVKRDGIWIDGKKKSEL